MLDQIDTLIAFALVMLLLSLLIMTIVQGANVLLQRRGRHLFWGVQQILKEMGVDSTDTAKKIAKKVLRYPTLSPSGIVYANAIRVDEMARLLGKVLPDVCSVLEKAKPWYKQLEAISRAASASSLEAIASQRAVNGPQSQEYIRSVVAGLRDPLVEALAKAGLLKADASVEQVRSAVETGLQQAVVEVQQTATKLKIWFDTVMDRTTERFVAWTRSITIVTSFVFCLIFQVDAVAILDQLSTNKELRAQLVGQVQPTLKNTQELIGSASAKNALGTEAIKRVHDQLQSKDPAGSALIKDVPADLVTEKKGEIWLRGVISDPAKQATMLELYHLEFQKVAEERFRELGASGKSLVDQLEKTQLKLFNTTLDLRSYLDWRHFGGMIVAGLFVSLGAPFWFNLLQNLSNLRPILAKKIETDGG